MPGISNGRTAPSGGSVWSRQPAEGAYLLSPISADAVTPVLLLGSGARGVVLGGQGLGGAPSSGPRVGGVSVSGGPSRRDGSPTVELVSAFPGPLLLISAKDDPVFPTGTTGAIAAAHPGPEVVLVPDTTMPWRCRPEHMAPRSTTRSPASSTVCCSEECCPEDE